MKATVIGLTSRGAAICGEMEAPAIYTRIKAHLPWIRNSVVMPPNASVRLQRHQTILLITIAVIVTKFGCFMTT